MRRIKLQIVLVGMTGLILSTAAAATTADQGRQSTLSAAPPAPTPVAEQTAEKAGDPQPEASEQPGEEGEAAPSSPDTNTGDTPGTDPAPAPLPKEGTDAEAGTEAGTEGGTDAGTEAGTDAGTEGGIETEDAMPPDIEATGTEGTQIETEATVTREEAEITATKTDQEKWWRPITAGAELGASFSQPLSKLGTSLSLAVDVGYRLPQMEERIQIYIGAAYSQPRHRETATDSRLPGDGSYEFKIIERQLAFSLGALYRFFPPRAEHDFHGYPINFYAQFGLRLELQRADERGRASSGRGFGLDQETATKIGMLLAGGAEYSLGPGAIAAELNFTVADLDHRLTGETTAGGLMLQVGYHFMF
ncbi:MAG: hypothetical protein V3S30_03940 [Thermoanaerobaculia bacterium]